MSLRPGKWLVMGLTGISLVTAGWIGSPRAQVSVPSAFSETYGNWTVRCTGEPTEEDGSARRCAMELRFVWRDTESGRHGPLLTVTLTPLPADGGMEAVVLTPFGLLFENGLHLRADRQRTMVFPFHTCYSDGCIVRGSLDREMIDGLRAGVVLRIEAKSAEDGNQFRLESPLTGFTGAHKRLLREIESR